MSVYDAIKDAVALAQKADNAELLQRLLDAQRGTLEMQEELQRLRRQVAEFEEQKQIEEDLEFDGVVYWLDFADGDRDGPYCQLCWDDRDKLIRLQDSKRGFFWCHACETSFDHDEASGSRRKPRSRRVVDRGVSS